MAEFKNHNHLLIQFPFMKKAFVALTALALLFACTAENKNENGGSKNNLDELIVTGEVLEVAAYSAILCGYANLPFEFGDVEVGIMYDTNDSFKAAEKIAATELGGDNMFTVTAADLEASTTYYYKSYAQNGMAMKYGAVKSFTTKEPSYPKGSVDLGVVITRGDGTSYKLYWAECNLGAEKPEEYGDYYAWGEVYTKNRYSWNTYAFWTSGYSYRDLQFSKYNTSGSNGPVDKKTVLEPEDDVAYVKLGGKWRMPTRAEWVELENNCTSTWTSQNGVKGRKVTGPNGNSIFLPAAGYKDGTSLSYASTFGVYWSSSLNTDRPDDAWSLGFDSEDMGMFSGYYRYHGISVRPVSE